VTTEFRRAMIRRVIEEQTTRLDPEDEEQALAWIEEVSEFDNAETEDTSLT